MGKFLVVWGKDGKEIMRDTIGAGDVVDAHKKAIRKASEIMKLDTSQTLTVMLVQKIDI
jgi:hypothetical protein